MPISPSLLATAPISEASFATSVMSLAIGAKILILASKPATVPTFA